MHPTPPLHVVIAGGGIAAVEAVMALRDMAEDRVTITVLAPEPELELKPLRTAEPFSVDHVRRFPLADVLANFDAELRATGLAGVDAEAHVARLDDGTELSYDALVIAVGARPRAAYDRVITFGADARSELLGGLLADLEEGYGKSVAFVVPPGVSWPLPLYEIALMTARQVFGMGIDGVEMHLVTPEPSPLAIFGAGPSDAVAALLDEARIVFHGSAYADVRPGRIRLHPGDEVVQARRIVALPVLDGPAVPGVPAVEHGFIPADEHGRVRGVTDVYAIGDASDFPVKQGGLACQMADAVASYIAAQAGAPLQPEPFKPVLRGKLLTGSGAHFLRNPLHGGAGEADVSDFSLWYPPTKVSGRYLSQWLPHLAEAGRVRPPDTTHQDIEVALETTYTQGRRAMTLDPYSPVHHV